MLLSSGPRQGFRPVEWAEFGGQMSFKTETSESGEMVQSQGVVCLLRGLDLGSQHSYLVASGNPAPSSGLYGHTNAYTGSDRHTQNKQNFLKNRQLKESSHLDDKRKIF